MSRRPHQKPTASPESYADFTALCRRARCRLLRMHYESGVGHIGGNLSALDAMLHVHHRVMDDDDVFILSKGHSAGALYVTLWSLGRLADEELRQFHRDGTRLSGHPAPGALPEIPIATGSLGHGLAVASGIALARRFQERPGRVFCLTSDGEWQEGSTWEALIFGRHHQLDNLTVMIDHNRLQGFGTTREVASMEPLEERLQGFGVELETIDGHDPEALSRAISKKRRGLRVVLLETVKGKGVSFMENRMEWHYLPLDEERYEHALGEIGEP